MDNSVFFEAFAAAGLLVPCTYKPATPSAVDFNAQWQRPDVLMLGDDAQGTDYRLEFQTADLPPLRKGDALTVGGQGYTVRQPPQTQGDGFFSVAMLLPA